MAFQNGDDLNPGQTHSDELMGSAMNLNNAEKAAGSEKIDNSDIQNSEENPSFINNVTGRSNKSKTGGKFSFLKRKGPITGIVLTLVGGGMGISGLLSPALLIVHFKETMTEKFNTQLTSMDVRTNKMIKSKALGSFGVCGSVVNIRCKYSSMSKSQIKRFEKAGIEVVADIDKPTTLLGRSRVKELVFEGETISASQLSKKLEVSPSLRTAMKKGYNPLYAGFSDHIWNKAMFKLSISKKGIKIEGANSKEKLKDIQTKTKSPVEMGDVVAPKRGDFPDDEAYKKAVKEFDELDKVAKVVAEGTADIAASGTKAATKAATKGLTNTLKITGILDNLCLVYGTMRAVGFAAKTVRVAQLARYAMMFLTVADQIKAGGNPDPEDVSYLGSVLTAEVESKDDDGQTVKKTATDSFGYKYAAYGDVGTMPDSATQFLAGAGLTGSLIGITSLINKYLGKTPNGTCKTLNNTLVQIGSGIAGVGAAIFSGGITITTGAVIQGVAGILITGAIMALPALLKDIVAGVVVDESTVGELAGDAITSGASGMMGTTAALGGNSPLSVDQAIAYRNLSNKVIAQYNEEDRLGSNPLDISNKNTFMGSVFAKLIPNITKMSSMSGSLLSVSSVVFGSLSALSPVTKAADGREFEICKDPDYTDLELAADPYCNLVYGIPTDVLQNIEPLEVLDKLSGQINPETGDPLPGSGYEKFVNDCVNRETPIGYTGENFDKDDGKNCLINNTNPMNKYYYLYQIDQRVEKGMDEDLPEADGSGGATNGTADPGDSSQPANTISKQGGWSLKDGVDYSSVPCADGTDDKGTYTHPTGKFTIRTCNTKLGEVSSLISQRVLNMIKDAKADGVTLAGSSFRSYEAQQSLYSDNCKRGHCSPPTAKPGNSMHERGLATDFGNSSAGGAVFTWLSANGSKYGYINFKAENWHWSMSGT